VAVSHAAAETLPFEAATFDAALAQLVVHFMAAPVVGLGEMRRVTRVGGVVAASVWDYGTERSPISPFWAVVRTVDPDARGESHMPGVREGDLEALFAAAGLAEIEGSTLAAAVTYPSFDDWWGPYTRGVGPGGAYVARLDPRQQDTLREACRRALPSPPITIEATAWACRGVVDGR
jgi:SAM-dependent methyltransferase